MHNKNSVNIGGITCLIIAVYFMYRILLEDSLLPFSIETILASMHHLNRPWHIIIVGLLPIYIAFMLFGTAVFGVFVGSALQRWLHQYLISK